MTTLNPRGQVVQANTPSCGNGRPEARAHIDFCPLPKRQPEEQSKQCFEHTYGPTGLNNTNQWESVPTPGERPSHPVCAAGVVALEKKRVYPEQQLKETTYPGRPRTSEAPNTIREWGGWGRGGAPGRKPMQQPWDSLAPSGPLPVGQEADFRLSDARKKSFAHRTHADTKHLTRWHLDARESASITQIHTNTPREVGVAGSSGAVGAAASAVLAPPAGRRSGIPKEGASLHWYDDFRSAELARTPHTAR